MAVVEGDVSLLKVAYVCLVSFYFFRARFLFTLDIMRRSWSITVSPRRGGTLTSTISRETVIF